MKMRIVDENKELIVANSIGTINVEEKDIAKVRKFMEENNIAYTYHPEAWSAYAEREARFNLEKLSHIDEESMRNIEADIIEELMNHSDKYIDENRIADYVSKYKNTKEDIDVEETNEIKEVNISSTMMGDKLYFVLGVEDKNGSTEYTSEVTAEYKGSGGFDSDIKEATEANLVIGKRYPISSISIHNWRTDIYLQGVEGYFNSCMFTFYNIKGEIIDIVDTYGSCFGY